MICRIPLTMLACTVCLLAAAVTAQAGNITPKRIAVLGALPPLTDARLAEETREALRRDGHDVTVLDGTALSDSTVFNAQRYDLLVLPHADTFPAVAQENLITYLKGKGRLLCLGGPPFTRYAYQNAGGWRTWDKLMEELPETSAIIDIRDADVKRWTRATNDPARPSTLVLVDSPKGPALHFSFSHYTNWDNFAPPTFPQSPYPPGSTLLVFNARGDRQTDALVVEWRERDGSRWMATVPLTTTWKRYALSQDAFRYWPDNSAKGRGGPEDHFHPENARTLSLGLANSHAFMNPGPKAFWIANLAAARAPENAPYVSSPVLDALSPWYKLCRTTPGRWQPIIRYRGAVASQPPGRLIMHNDTRSGAEWVYRTYMGPFSGAAWGAKNRASRPGWSVQEMLREWYLAWGGPQSVAVSQKSPPEFTLHLANTGSTTHELRCEVRVERVGRSGSRRNPPHVVAMIQLEPGIEQTVTLVWPGLLSPGDYAYRIMCSEAGSNLTDGVEGRFTVIPSEQIPLKSMVTVQGGDFRLEGRVWRPVGVNYWPLWVSGQGEPEYWAAWNSPNQYDPVLIERELALAERLRINVLSVQYLKPEHARTLMDFLARCRNHRIKVNVFLAGGHPLSYDPHLLTTLIREARLSESDAVFAYDVAWEPNVGRHDARKRFDDEWLTWILANYGTVENAERVWVFPAPRAEGHLTNPPDEQFTTDGPWRRMIAAYRRFINERISRGYREVREIIRAVDPHHLIGARSGYGGNGSVYVEAMLAFDLSAGAKHLDFISPEGYALDGDWPAFRGGGGFTTAYARWAGNGKPVFWSEFGRSVYPQTTAEKVRVQGDYHQKVFRMIVDSGANGGAGWWWPGGLRIDENSDYGIISPDGQPRLAARMLRDFQPRIAAMMLPPAAPTIALTFDRDADARGYAGVWMKGRDEWTRERERGLFPVLRTEGTGTTTADVPLIAVGSVPAFPPLAPLKYADAELNSCSDERGRWTLSFGNTGEATWTHAGVGRVVLIVRASDDIVMEIPLPAEVPRFSDVTLTLSAVDIPAKRPLTARLAILGRTNEPLEFGQMVTLSR